MNIEELKENLRQIISLRDEIAELKKETRFGYSLREYLELVNNKLAWTDHGDRDKFWCPMHVATSEISRLFDINEKEFNSAFSKNKTKLLSILNRYIKDLQNGFRLYDLESPLTRDNPGSIYS